MNHSRNQKVHQDLDPTDWLATTGKQVLTLVGYSGMGYADPDALQVLIANHLDGFPPSDWVVNIGATKMGIGAAYATACFLGYVTTGIVSSRALPKAKFHPDCEHVFIIEDSHWGGLDEHGDLTPTSEAMVTATDQMLGFGGGRVGRIELCEAIRRDMPVRFIPCVPGKKRSGS